VGSITSDKGDDALQSTLALPNADGVPGSYQVTQALRQIKPTRCHSEGTVIYRDLTVPHNGQIERPALEISECEGDCPDE
jgi:hypothetical protein